MSETVEIERSIRLLVEPGSTFEVRALGKQRGREVTLAGYFTDPAIAARAIAKVDAAGEMTAIYATLNPVRPELRARCADRLDVAGKGGTTGDQHIVKRTRLLVDVDGAPVSGVSTSDEEHAAAIALAQEIAGELSERGWPDPLRGDSGNGAHLVYAIDLPVECDDLVGRVLDAAQARWGCTVGNVTLKVDGKNRNPARITKLFGTVARKGDDTPDRPHRRSRILAAPEKLEVVTLDQLTSFVEQFTPAKQVTARPATRPTGPAPLPTLDLRAWLSKFGLQIKNESDWQGGTMFELDECPANSDHTHGEAWVAQFPSGAIDAGCHHESCKHVTWAWLREKYEPVATRGYANRSSPTPPTQAARTVVEHRPEPSAPVVSDARFRPALERLRGERDDRIERGRRALTYHNAFLDDQLRAITYDDLVLFGAESGAGKTQFVTGVAQSLVKQGKRVHMLALEAHDGEIEQRMLYTVIADLMNGGRGRKAIDGHEDLNFPDWMLGRCEDITAPVIGEARGIMASDYRTLHTFYRGSHFDGDDMRRQILAIQAESDLIILDHLHYVDAKEDENENRNFKRNMQILRNLTILLKKPIFAVAHLRKSDRLTKRLVPELEDFHGSGDIGKIATRAILMAPARDQGLVVQWHSSPTYVTVEKDRVGGKTGHVAVMQFDRRTRSYWGSYTLGRLSPDGKKWTQLDTGPGGKESAPRWAKHHVRMETADAA